MPLKTIASLDIKRLEILDLDGHVDKSLMPKVSDKLLLEMYRLMFQIRHFDERAILLQRSGRLGTYPMITGQAASQTLAQKAWGYGVHGLQVDGNDALAVYAATVEAVARARKGEGATLIECETYRMSHHTTADDATRYREDKEVESWKKRDPI